METGVSFGVGNDFLNSIYTSFGFGELIQIHSDVEDECL
jgi:hypothetical protein